MTDTHPVIIIGAGQAGLSVGYYLRRAGVPFHMFDAEDAPGGAWRHGWNSLRLFSPAEHSSLPGWPMPQSQGDGFPTRDAVIDYLTQYEERYSFPIARPVRVLAVHRRPEGFAIETDRGAYQARLVVSATGTWGKPYVPLYPGQEAFQGFQLHSAQYVEPSPFAGKRLLIVGGGNSGAQILAEVSKVADAVWVTSEEPQLLPDDVDGRVLFQQASKRFAGEPSSPGTLANIVAVPSVREARERGVLKTVRPFQRFTETGVVWAPGHETRMDGVIWCTGFRPALDHLAPLGILEPNGRVEMNGYRAAREPNLWLAGYGDWTGFASATLIGAGRTARDIGKEIAAFYVASSPQDS